VWSPVYNPRLAQYCHSLYRLSDKYLWRRVEIFVHPTYIVNTLYLTLQATVLHMEYIKRKRITDFSYVNGLNQTRLKTPLSFLRQTGLLNNNTSPSIVQTLYTTVGAVCYYSTWMCAILDTYVHRYDLTKFMEKMRMVFVMSLVAWMNLFAGRPPYKQHCLKKFILHNKVSNTDNISKIT
jgi:hypothetical protein